MNYFKHSDLPKLAANRLKRKEARNPNKHIRKGNKMLKNLDIMDVYAARQTLSANASTAWKGGDLQDRQEYIAAQKAKVGSSLERVLTLSNKRMPSGHYLKDDRGYLEFKDVKRGREIVEFHPLQPSNIAFGMEEFLKNGEARQESVN